MSSVALLSRPTPTLSRAGLLLGALVLAGCASDAPRPTLLTLPPVALAAGAAPATSAASAVPGVLVVRRVEIPEYLAARRVRYRADASTLAEWPNTYWAERIETGVQREFTAAMRQALPGWTVCEGTCADRTPTLSVQVVLGPLDYVRGQGRLRAQASVAVATMEAPPKVLRTLDLPLDQPVATDQPQAHAQAISDALRALAAGVGPAVTAAAGTLRP